MSVPSVGHKKAELIENLLMMVRSGLTRPKEPLVENSAGDNVWRNLTRAAGRYTNAHRSVILYLLKNGVVSKKRFYIVYSRYYVVSEMRLKPCVLETLPTTAEELDSFTRKIIDAINSHIVELGLRVVLTRSEEDGAEFVVLICERQHSEILSIMSSFSQDEVVLITRLLSEMIEKDGMAEEHWCLQQAFGLPNPMPATKAQELILKLEKNKWIKNVDGELWLEPRAVAELEPLLRAKYDLANCCLCQAVVIRFSDRAKVDDIPCPGTGCDAKLSIHQGLKASRTELGHRSRVVSSDSDDE